MVPQLTAAAMVIVAAIGLVIGVNTILVAGAVGVVLAIAVLLLVFQATSTKKTSPSSAKSGGFLCGSGPRAHELFVFQNLTGHVMYYKYRGQ